MDLEKYADAMFEAGGDITGKTAEEVFRGDYKIFTSGEVRFGVGQGSYMSQKNRLASEKLLGPYLPIALEKQGLDFIFYMFTDVRSASTDLLMAGKAPSAWWSTPSAWRSRTAWRSCPRSSAEKSRWSPP